MALQSEVSPHLVGDPNKDTQIEGDTKSEEDDSSQSTDDEVDLEEGEILDSSEEKEEKEKKDLTNSSLQEALDKNMLKSIEQLVSQAKSDTPVPVTKKTVSPHASPRKIKKRPSKYLDHDKFESSDNDDGWYSVSRKSKSSKYDKPIDYRKELEAYRGTPPSSPDSKHRDKKKKRSKKSKKSGKKIIKRKDIKGVRVSKYLKESMRLKLCKFFKDGNCAKGADCAFSHALPHSYNKKKELCKFYLSGHCNKGKGCIYMHGEFPCKFYHTGSECYAKDACRFSHAPLTEEMKQILADYLRISRGDDDFDRKRRCSPSPERVKAPPPKRTCLLGSPPRHIREAEETKRWQEEMFQHRHDNPAFKIHVSPSRDNESPPFQKPNFYKDTLPCTPSPNKRRNALNNSRNNFPSKPSSSGYETYSRSSPSDNFVYEEDYQDLDDEVVIKQEPPEVPDFSWANMHSVDHNSPPVKPEVEPFTDSAQQDLDFTNDVKFDETTQFSEMESSIECSASSPPNSMSQPAAISKEIDGETPNLEAIKSEDKGNDDSNSAQESIPIAPIVIPSHLPKKQQELFKRIFQHQKKTEMAASASDASNSPKYYDNAEPMEKETEEVKEKPEVEKSEPSVWYSSEEDDSDSDSDSDEPLTDVLKKLQKEPPSVKPPVKIESRPPDDILALLNKVSQLDKHKGASESPQSDFFTNLLSGKIPCSSNMQPPCALLPEPRRTLLPDPKVSIKKEPLVVLKDPRLKNRDPRTLTTTVNNALNLPNQTVLQTSSIITQENKMTIPSSVTTVISESVKEGIPYKLRGIYTKPPNYTPYINASQSNPNLLKDPRLRKHLTLQTIENGIEVKRTEAPPIPKLLLAYDKFEPINIFESSPTPKPPVVEESQNVKPIRSKLVDPRMKRRDSQNSSGSNTPPHLTAVDNLLPSFGKTNSLENIRIKEEKKWSPPLLEKAWNPPAVEHTESITIKQEVDSDTDDPLRLEIDECPPSSSKDAKSTSNVVKKPVPIPASHLPRAIADPRMARLHGPLDSRRARVGNIESASKNLELMKNISPNENLTDASKTSPLSDTLTEGELKAGKTIPKKKTNKSDEKKKSIHRNRKSSMDYASPLNSCDDSNSNKSLNYNSYNQRPPRTVAAYAIPDSSNSMNSVTSESTPDFLSDNSNLDCDNSIDVNLKDKFKTIDPTASPFC